MKKKLPIFFVLMCLSLRLFAQAAVVDILADKELVRQGATQLAQEAIQKLETKIANKAYEEATKQSKVLGSTMDLLSQTYSASSSGTGSGVNILNLPQAKNYFGRVGDIASKVQQTTGLLSKYGKYAGPDKLLKYRESIIGALGFLKTSVKISATATDNNIKITMKERIDILGQCDLVLDKADAELDRVLVFLEKDKSQYEELETRNSARSSLYD